MFINSLPTMLFSKSINKFSEIFLTDPYNYDKIVNIFWREIDVCWVNKLCKHCPLYYYSLHPVTVYTYLVGI